MEDPFPYNNINTERARHQGLGVISMQCIELSLHGEVTSQVKEGGADGRRHRREDRRVEVEAVHGPANASFAMSVHVVHWSLAQWL